MRRTTRNAAGALALAVTLGAGGPVAASAAGHGDAVHVTADRGSKADKDSKDGIGSSAGKGSSADTGSRELRQLLRDIAKNDERLSKVAKESRTMKIGDHRAAVLANVAHDRAALADLAAAVQSAESALDLRVVRKELRDVREQNYNKVVNDLRHGLRLAAELAAARVALAEDLAAPVAELDAAQLALDSAMAKALAITASSEKSELRAVKADLVVAHQAYDVVRDYLDGALEEEPVEEEPVEEEPVEEEPVV